MTTQEEEFNPLHKKRDPAIAKIVSLTEAEYLKDKDEWHQKLCQQEGLILCCNGFGLTAEEDIIENSLYWVYNPTILINNKRIQSPTESINEGLREAFKQGHQAIEVSYPVQFVVGRETLDKIGFLDSIFRQQFYMYDFIHRANLAGVLPGIFPDELEALELENRGVPTEWDLVKFGSKWSIPPTVTPQEFWNYLCTTEYIWSEEMKVD